MKRKRLKKESNKIKSKNDHCLFILKFKPLIGCEI